MPVDDAIAMGGMPIHRIKNGVVINMNKLPADITNRIELLGRMNDRRKHFRNVRDWRGLLYLAKQYERMFEKWDEVKRVRIAEERWPRGRRR